MRSNKKRLFGSRNRSDEDVKAKLYIFAWVSQIIADALLFIGGCFLVFKVLQYVGII